MERCDVCGNQYDKPITVSTGDVTQVFDSFECAIHALAPRCAHCDCRIIGHGIESKDTMFCCAHCASEQGYGEARDRV